VTHLFALAYLSGWAIESLALFAASHWLHDSNFRAPPTSAVGLLAGAVWPLVTLGVVQYGAVAAVSKMMSDREAAALPSSRAEPGVDRQSHSGDVFRVIADQREGCIADVRRFRMNQHWVLSGSHRT
jgi:hypothetical protein